MKRQVSETTEHGVLMPYVTSKTFLGVVEDITTRRTGGTTALQTMSEDNPELYGLVVRLAAAYSMGEVQELQGVILGSTACYTALHRSLLFGRLPKVTSQTCLSMTVSAMSNPGIGLGEGDVIKRDNPEFAQAIHDEANRFERFRQGRHAESVTFGAEAVYGALRRQTESGWMSSIVSI